MISGLRDKALALELLAYAKEHEIAPHLILERAVRAYLGQERCDAGCSQPLGEIEDYYRLHIRGRFCAACRAAFERALDDSEARAKCPTCGALIEGAPGWMLRRVPA